MSIDLVGPMYVAWGCLSVWGYPSGRCARECTYVPLIGSKFDKAVGS